MHYIIIDTETTGLPDDMNQPANNTKNWPHFLSIAWEVWEVWEEKEKPKEEEYGYEEATPWNESGWAIEGGEDAYNEAIEKWQTPHLMEKDNYLTLPRIGVVNSPEAFRVNKITPEMQADYGSDIRDILNELLDKVEEYSPCIIIAHNAAFDQPIIEAEMHRAGIEIPNWRWECTKEMSAHILIMPITEKQSKYRPDGTYKLPSLNELYQFLFNEPIPGREESHGAAQDAAACAACLLEMKKRGLVNI